jgi:uncharacterized protein HemX
MKQTLSSWAGPIVAVVLASAGALVGYGVLQTKTAQVEISLDAVEKQVLRLEERKVDSRQLDETSARLTRIEEKIDRLVERVGMRR